MLAGIGIVPLSGANFEPVFMPPEVNRWDVVEFQPPENFVFTDWRSVPQLRAALETPVTPQEGPKNTGRRQEYAALTDSRIQIERPDGRFMRKRERFIQRPGRIAGALRIAAVAA